jgi:hypothetical protein
VAVLLATVNLLIGETAQARPESVLNTHAAQDQQAPALAGGFDGTFAAVWQSTDQDEPGSNNWGIFGQRLRTITGAGWLAQQVAWSEGPEFQVNQEVVGDQILPRVAQTDSGVLVVAWMDVQRGKSYLGIQDRAGQPAANQEILPVAPAIVEVRVMTPDICVAGEEIIVVWTEERHWKDWDGDTRVEGWIRARRYGIDGSPVGDVITVESYSDLGSDPSRASTARVGCHEDGSFAIVWGWSGGVLFPGAYYIPRLSYYDEQDAVVWNQEMWELRSSWVTPAIAVQDDHTVVVAHEVALLAGFYPNIWIYLTFHDSNGVDYSTELLASYVLFEWYPRQPAIGIRGDRLLVAWREGGYESNGQEQHRIRAARFDLSGGQISALPWADFPFHATVTLSEKYDVVQSHVHGVPAITRPDGEGRFAVAWAANRGSTFDARAAWDVVIRCFDDQGASFPCGIDLDGDDVIDSMDCDRFNASLSYDLDSDLVCDRPVGFDPALCATRCSEAYVGTRLGQCLARCSAPDNCVCVDPTACPSGDADYHLGVTLYEDYCRDEDYLGCIHLGETNCSSLPAADICHRVFANSNQGDGNQNGRGDRCESAVRASITLTDPDEHASVWGNKGYLCSSSGGSFPVTTVLEGGMPSVDQGQLTFGTEQQRTSVGACGCAPELVEAGFCETLQYRRTDGEADAAGHLAWGAIFSSGAAIEPNLGYAGHCATCPRTIDSLNEPHAGNEAAFRSYAINKDLTFTHETSANEHRYTWLWPDAPYRKGDLTGKVVRGRVAWQRPEAMTYEYYLPGSPQENQVAFSARREMAYSQGCQTIPWKLTSPDGSVSTLLRLIERPWGYTDPPREVDPSFWVLLSDTVTDDRYVISYGANTLEPAAIHPVACASGACANLDPRGAAATSGMIDTASVGVDSQRAPAVFLYGTKNVDGSISRDLWIGLPTHENNRWLRASEIYGRQAGAGPLFAKAHLVFDSRAERLVVLGALMGTGEIAAPGDDEIWTFELREGRWQRQGPLDVGFPLAEATVSLDPLRHRAIVYGAAWASRRPTTDTHLLDLATLRVTELETAPADEDPLGLARHGAFFEPVEQALYVYGGESITGEANLGAHRLDLVSRQWTYLGEGSVGPGMRERPFVSFDRLSRTLWVVGGEVDAPQPGLVVSGLRDGEWYRKETLREPETTGWVYQGRFDLHAQNRFPLFAPDTGPLPGMLQVAHLDCADPAIGLVVRDSGGQIVAEDLGPTVDKRVIFYSRGLQTLELKALPSDEPAQHPPFTITVTEAALSELGRFTGSSGVNDLLVQGGLVYLVGERGLQAVSVADPSAPQVVGQLDLRGAGTALGACGELTCIGVAPKGGVSLKVVDVADPAAMQVVDSLKAPGVSRSVGVKGTWLYLSSGGAGVSIVDVRDPSAPVLVDRLVLPGVVTALSVASNRLFVALHPSNVVRIYELTEEQSPVFLSEVYAIGAVEAMRLLGTELHVSTHEGTQGWQGCISGRYCPPGTSTRVYEIADPATPEDRGSYDEVLSPATHLRQLQDLVLVRTSDGFVAYRAVPAP